MLRIAQLLLLLAFALEAFAYWGLGTASGQQAFDEMAGLFPFYAGILGIVLLLCAGLFWWIARRRATVRRG